MNSLNRKMKTRKIFAGKDAELKKRVHNEFIDKGVATIPCNVEDYYDIISHYSVEGYETLNPEFADYIKNTVAYIPPEYPISLEICGAKFTSKQQEAIKNTIREDMMYELGAIQKTNKRLIVVFLFMLIGMIASGMLIPMFNSGFSAEFIYVIFWFCADFVVSYVCLDGKENLSNRVTAGRLASMCISFFEKFDDRELTIKEVEAVYEDIKK